MKQKQRDLYLAYILNQRTFMEQDISELQSRVRFRVVSLPDLLELIIAKVRLETFNEVTKDITFLLDIENERKLKK